MSENLCKRYPKTIKLLSNRFFRIIFPFPEKELKEFIEHIYCEGRKDAYNDVMDRVYNFSPTKKCPNCSAEANKACVGWKNNEKLTEEACKFGIFRSNK